MQCPKSQLPRPARASGAFSVDLFFRIPASAERQQLNSRRNHKRQPNACIFSRQQQTDSGAKIKRRTGSKESGANERMPATHLAHAHWECTGWPVRGARPSVRAQSRARLPAYSPLTRCCNSVLRGSGLTSFACTPLQARFPSGGDSA